MRNIVISMAFLAGIGFVSCKNEVKKETTPTEQNETAMTKVSFVVKGNCGMCKKTIEKAANGVEGVINADWDKKTKEIHLIFNATKTSVEAVHKAIAASGYDTDKESGNLESYQNLPECCQYDDKVGMSVEEGVTQETH